MANYLPVLLVSVTTNSIPDDSSVSTLPRGQVDYLSHDWQEEDVWRSWRNMTRQKNEIANGMRLENASWRTWWKQRNNLKTVTPEKLNWLKDSDVTWLYGPLHTAVDWTPPPKPKPDPSSVDKSTPNSAHDRLDLSLPNPKFKPILKHRSISELLTSDLPISPLFSPAESENEGEGQRQADLGVIMEEDGETGNGREGEGSWNDTESKGKPKRPILMHTKSDTHIARWGPNRAFRKDSPPRIIATDPGGTAPAPGPSSHHSHAYSPTNLNGYFSAAATQSHVDGSHNHHASANPPSSNSPRLGGEEPIIGANGHANGKKKHISFNTFVEQCIAIEKPKKVTEFGGGGVEGKSGWNGKTKGVRWDQYDDGYDEDDEDGYEGMWNGSAIESDSDSEYEEEVQEGVDDASEDDDDDDDDDVLEMRTSSSSRYNINKKSPWSKSKASTSSSSSASTSSSGQGNPNRRNLRRPTTNGFRPPLIRTPSSGEKEHVHVTIAPIAPTILKTTGVGNGWSGDGEVGWVESEKVRVREREVEEFGWSDEGIVLGGAGGNLGQGHGCGGRKGESGPGMPVELVYVPPLGSNYCMRVEDDDDANGRREEEEHVYHHRTACFSVGMCGYADEGENVVTVTPASPTGSMTFGRPVQPIDIPVPIADAPPLPVMVRTPPAVEGDGAEDAYDYFGGPDLGEDFARRRTHVGRKKGEAAVGPGDEGIVRYAQGGAGGVGVGRSSGPVGVGVGVGREKEKEKERSRSRSRSRSRTPSPAYVTSTGAVPVPGRSNSFDSRPTSPPSALLSPPLRGRGAMPGAGADSQSHSRGRSSTRTSSSFSDRERSSHSSHSSPLGSLSPDGSAVALAGVSVGVGVCGVYANGRVDRERRDGGDRERGRDRVGRRLSQSLSPDDLDVNAARKSMLNAGSGSSSSVSSSNTIIPSSGQDKPAEAPSIAGAIPKEREGATLPADSPVVGRNPPPLAVPVPQPASPSTTRSPNSVLPSTSRTTGASRSNPPSTLVLQANKGAGMGVVGPTLDGDGTIVGKAVGMVSTAGAYLGLWQGGATV